MQASGARHSSGTILIVDGTDNARGDLAGPLRRHGYVVQAIAAVESLLDARLPESPCCILADLGLVAGQGEGLDLLARLKARGAPIPVIFLTGRADMRLGVRAIKAGAADVLARPLADCELHDAVRDALAADGARHSRAHATRAIEQCFERLTPRERQVMDGVVRGLMNKQIAWELAISEITVKLHRSSMMRKMELRSVPDLVRAAQALRRPAEPLRAALA